ncbi:CPBP family intramembrane glutamic endopeptidase [Prochlorococcus sp. MIT 1341]|uniref:CPBP family intramembrane glutamic endopeptidase n=1 Tax=Prochlorococcus sp. MIT 1341 TaxID=3096221 RepID=UPI002A75768C|nr:CPBP family intramembrane glutamic endopeptidase [Prochlorococcus sp. MIT 1341]
MRTANPTWKIALAIISIIISLAVWKQGLEQSFNRPSVAPALSLSQQEMALLAKPAVPRSFQSLLIGTQPETALRESLMEIPLDQMEDHQRLLLAALENSNERKKLLLDFSLEEASLEPVKKVLIEGRNLKDNFEDAFGEELVYTNPLLIQASCFSIGGNESNCIDQQIAKRMALRLGFSQGLPLIALFIGSGLLLRQIWILFRGLTLPWPAVIPIPLSSMDMVLLVAGGFVVLGEVVSPTLVLPITSAMTSQLASPFNESVKVLVGYCSMTVAPLVILSRQLKSLEASLRPENGWLQWRLSPWNTAISRAIVAWLMVLPPVLITGWLVSFTFGDQGGSNPLLELVLSSRDPVALGLLVVTTVVLAPLFEELVFRGVLLPVLVKEIGRSWALVMSAIVFAMAHLSVSEFPPLLVLGVGLALLRLSTGRLLPCVLMHALWNGMTFFNLVLLAG